MGFWVLGIGDWGNEELKNRGIGNGGMAEWGNWGSLEDWGFGKWGIGGSRSRRIRGSGDLVIQDWDQVE